MWTRLCNLRMEACCPSLMSRINGRLTKHAAKSLLSGRQSTLQVAVSGTLRRHPEVPGPNSYGLTIVKAITECGLRPTVAALTQDSPHPLWQTRPPWIEDDTNYHTVRLPRPKHLCSMEEITMAANCLFHQPSLASAVHLFTDGSVDTSSGAAGAAVWSLNHQECWRITSGSSTAQTELSAIKRALEIGLTLRAPTVNIVTDSMTAIQAIRHRQPTANIQLITSIQHLISQYKVIASSVSLTWVPSHSGIRGNEHADTLAKQALLLPTIRERVQPTVSQLAGPISKYQSGLLRHQQEAWVSKGSPSANWYKLATRLEPSPVMTTTPRLVATTVTRLRLGHKCIWELIDAAPQPCPHCNVTPDYPLLHYLLRCTATSSLRALTTEDHHQLHPGDNATAASLVYDIIDNLPEHLAVLQHTPPPC